MIGCLTAPFRALGCLVLVIALGWGWLHRDRLVAEARRMIGGSSGSAPAAVSSSARPGKRARRTALAKVDSLNGWRADSVVLTPAEVASLLSAGLDPDLRQRLDSLRVELREGEIVVSARLATDRLSRDLVGPLAGMLRPTEAIQATGPLAIRRPGRGEWTVRQFRIRDFPLPREVVGRLLARATGDSAGRAIPFRVPAGVRDIRVRPSGAWLLGAPPS